jgi:hypothetical protein
MATAQEVAGQFNSFRKRGLDRAVARGIDNANTFTVRFIKRTYFGRGPTRRDMIINRTFTLRDTVRKERARVRRSGRVEAKLKMGNRRTPQARILELGGRTRPHIILPRNGSVLVFMKDGATIFARQVNHPGSVIEPRAPLGRGAAATQLRRIQSVDRALVKQIKAEGL